MLSLGASWSHGLESQSPKQWQVSCGQVRNVSWLVNREHRSEWGIPISVDQAPYWAPDDAECMGGARVR